MRDRRIWVTNSDVFVRFRTKPPPPLFLSCLFSGTSARTSPTPYEPLASGKLKLAALEYVVLKAAWDAKHATEPVMFGHKFNETYGGNRFGLPAFYSLHVWLFKHNPSGQFAMWNPRVHCASQS